MNGARPSFLPPALTKAAVGEICCGLKQNAAKARFLRRLGVVVNFRPDGSLLVSRLHCASVRGGVKPVGAATGAVVNWKVKV